MDIFLSVGSGLSPEQESFVQAIEARLRAEGFTPHTLDRNEWSTLAPLDAVEELMGRCRGAVIVGLERYRFAQGVERRGSDRERKTGPVCLPTSWNQIEAALAYSKQLPLLVIIDQDLKADGLLEPGHDWYVANMPVRPDALQTASFNGLLRSWQGRVAAAPSPVPAAAVAENARTALDPSKTSIGDLLRALYPAQLWALLGALAILVGGAFTLGVKLAPALEKPPAQQASKTPA